MSLMIPGAILNEKYRLVEQIGEGGMATIWRAVQISLDRPVAVKFISAMGPSASKYVERFLEEAKLAAAIRHRNVIDIVDFGTTEGGMAYMVLELLEGESLAERLARLPPLNLGEIVNIAVLALSGLQAVHNAGVVHRDLKPENIFLVSDDDGVYPKLLDFGVSKSVERKEGRALTQEGLLVGTPQYMAPEQARGMRDVDHRIDVWAMGVILYEVLTGRLPYDSENVGDILIQIVSQDAPPISFYRPEVGPELSAVVQRAMARNREERFQDAKEMRSAIMEAAAQMGDAAGMWGRITPGSGLIHPEQLNTPISGLIQVVAVENARAAQRSAAATARATGDQQRAGESAASGHAKTMPAMLRTPIPTPSTSAPAGRRDPTDDVRLVRTSVDDLAAVDGVPSAPAQPVAARRDASAAVDLPEVREPKKGGGAIWVFLGIFLIGGAAATALAVNPSLLDSLSELVGGAGALPMDAEDLGTEALDAGPPDLGPPDLGPPDLGPPDLGPPDLGPPDAGPTDDAGSDEDAVDLGPEVELTPTKRPTKWRPIRRPNRRPIRRPAPRR